MSVLYAAYVAATAAELITVPFCEALSDFYFAAYECILTLAYIPTRATNSR